LFVATADDKVVGVVCVYAQVKSEAVDEEEYEYAYISDLAVLAADRGKGLGRALLKRAEEYARLEGARLLRISVLAKNSVARSLYVDDGFQENVVILEKSL
jgi:ribosomal protein S18 acetylase RimI-like enzyme